MIAMQHIHLPEADEADGALHIADVYRLIITVKNQNVLVEWVHTCPIVELDLRGGCAVFPLSRWP